jgi:hypothetical protein
MENEEAALRNARRSSPFNLVIPKPNAAEESAASQPSLADSGI